LTSHPALYAFFSEVSPEDFIALVFIALIFWAFYIILERKI